MPLGISDRNSSTGLLVSTKMEMYKTLRLKNIYQLLQMDLTLLILPYLLLTNILEAPFAFGYSYKSYIFLIKRLISATSLAS